MHALDRINERYGNNYTISDIFTIITLIKKGLYLEIVKDFVDRDRITVLLRYNNIPMKLVYSKTDEKIITALPLDIDEYNEYCDLVPIINTDNANSINYENDANAVRNKFMARFRNKNFSTQFQLDELIKTEIKFYVKKYSNRFVVLWFKTDKDSICYQLYSYKALQKRLWHYVINGFRKQDTRLFKNAVLLYAKIYK